ncbi:MAG: hypothetical protein ACOY90_12875 [Candidatus Zhuqueibacterota bacterium]
MKLNRYSSLWLFTIIAVLAGSFSGCSKSVPTYEMEIVKSFRLNIPNVDLDKYFKRVTDVDLSQNGGFVIVDIAGPGVLLFDEQGNYINNIAGYGSGNFETLCSATFVDTLIAVYTLNQIEFFTANGTPVKRHFTRGRGDAAIARDGSFVFNRMIDARTQGACLETYDTNGKLITKFRSPRAKEEGMEMLDFGFSRLTPDSRIVYVPVVVDSAFIYDFNGNVLLSKKLKSALKPYKNKDDKPGALVEDVVVNDDGIFIVRLDKELSNETIVYFNLIEQYDFNLNRVAAYKFATPITMTTATEIYSPWYNNFAVRNGVFYLMVSQPFQQLIAFQAKK